MHPLDRGHARWREGIQSAAPTPSLMAPSGPAHSTASGSPPSPKTLLGSLQEASEHEDKAKIHEALTPELRDLIRENLDFRPYLKSKIAVLKELAIEHGWENTDDVDIDAVNKILGEGIVSGAIRSTQERDSVELQGGSPFRSN